MGKRIMGRIQDAEGVDESARMIPHSPTPVTSVEEKAHIGASQSSRLRGTRFHAKGQRGPETSTFSARAGCSRSSLRASGVPCER